VEPQSSERTIKYPQGKGGKVGHLSFAIRADAGDVFFRLGSDGNVYIQHWHAVSGCGVVLLYECVLGSYYTHSAYWRTRNFMIYFLIFSESSYIFLLRPLDLRERFFSDLMIILLAVYHRQAV
jgi:hypothetical protein